MLSLLEPVLQHARHWRDWGNFILIIFLVIEFFLEAWPELPSDWSPWDPPKRYKLWLDDHRRSKKWITVGAALGVLAGVTIETIWSNRIDDIVDAMRISVGPRIEGLSDNERADKLVQELKEVERPARRNPSLSLIG
jgi:hypothetical protein